MKFLLSTLLFARRPVPFLFLVLPSALLTGRLFPNQASSFQTLGLAGLGLFLLPSFPIVVSSIVTAFKDLSKSRDDKGYLSRLFIVTITFCCLAAGIGIICSLLWSAGSIDDDARTGLGQLLDNESNEIQIYIRSEPPSLVENNIFDNYINMIVPSNLLKHLTQGETLKVLVASAAFGISLSKISIPLALKIEQGLLAINQVSTQLLDTLLKFSPIIIFFLIAGASSGITYSTASALLGLFAAVATGCFILVIISHIFIKYSLRRHKALSRISAYSNSKPSADYQINTMSIFMLGITTSNSLALFSSIRKILSDSGFNLSQINTSIIVSLLLARAGNILYNSSVIIFALNLYNMPLSPLVLFSTLALSVLAGLAASGLSGIAAITVIVLALDSMQIPSAPVLILVMSVDPVFVMLRAATTGVVSLSSSSLICSIQPASD
jgi:Na+/H+-dicarboxylate symporter